MDESTSEIDNTTSNTRFSRSEFDMDVGFLNSYSVPRVGRSKIEVQKPGILVLIS